MAFRWSLHLGARKWLLGAPKRRAFRWLLGGF